MLRTIDVQTGEIADDQSLTALEQADLERCEATIQKGYHAFIEVGAALIEVRDKKLYRAQAETFADYVETRWKISRSRAYQLISAGLLSTQVDIQNERQARELKRLPEEMRPLAWNIASENSERVSPGKPVSTRLLRATVNVLDTAKTTGGYVDTGDGEMTALDAALTLEAHETMQRQRQHIRDKEDARKEDDGLSKVFEGYVSYHSHNKVSSTLTAFLPRETLAHFDGAKPGKALWIVVYEVKEEFPQ